MNNWNDIFKNVKQAKRIAIAVIIVVLFATAWMFRYEFRTHTFSAGGTSFEYSVRHDRWTQTSCNEVPPAWARIVGNPCDSQEGRPESNRAQQPARVGANNSKWADDSARRDEARRVEVLMDIEVACRARRTYTVSPYERNILGIEQPPDFSTITWLGRIRQFFRGRCY